jgi:hypothetical protein
MSKISVAEPHQFYAAPVSRKKIDAVLAPTLLYNMLTFEVEATFSFDF